MAGFFTPKHRSVIPRWRLFASTIAMGELGGERTKSRAAVHPIPQAQIREFAARPTIWHATDLLSAAIVAGHAESAAQAATFITDNVGAASSAALDLARSVLHPAKTSNDEFDGDWKQQIRESRRSLARSPRNAMRWMDLGLAYTVLGMKRSAMKAAVAAVGLAPDNRFVLRSAARCFLHWGEADRAHSILKASAATRVDPWLLSAEIAIAAARQRRSSNFTEGRRMVVDANFSPYDISELACGLGSAEFEAGSRRIAVPLLSRSMLQPTENSVAQVEYVFNLDNKLALALEDVHIPRLYEASALETFSKGDFEAALLHSRHWLADQPFSSRPADFASYIASVLERYDEAAALLEGSRVSNPDEQMILNNLAYFCLMADDIATASRWMAQIKQEKIDEKDRPVFTATGGLFKFRTGDVEGGRAAYLEAVRAGVRLRQPRLEALALLNLSREELTAGSRDRAEQHLREARVAAKKAGGVDIKTMLENLESKINMPA